MNIYLYMCAALGVFEHNLESPDRKSYQSSVICFEFLEFSEIHLKLELERKKEQEQANTQ